MPNNLFLVAVALLTALMLTGCSEARQDPCRLLSVSDAQAIDDTVAHSVWAGADGEKQEGEVCVFYTDDGSSRLMVFFWYDRNRSPGELVANGAAQDDARISALPGVGTEASAAFHGEVLKLLAVRSSGGTIGMRVAKTVLQGTPDFDVVARMAVQAADRFR